MKKNVFKKFSLAVIFIMIFAFMGSTLAADSAKFIGVDEIRPGMKGIAKTVISGTAIEEFNVEVLGILKDKGPAGDVILVKTSGSVIDKTGGIAEGMSGSPVYFNGRLAGAVAFGWSFVDHTIGMVTPIADMLKIWDLESNNKSTEQSVNPLTEEKEREAAAVKAEQEKDAAADKAGQAKKADDSAAIPENIKDIVKTASIEKVSTPFFANGFSGGAVKFLQSKMPQLNIINGDTYGANASGVDAGALVPGSAVAAQLMRGDTEFGGIGTVTYVEDGKVLAFGHPFLQKGSIRFIMSDAYIYTVVKSVNIPFKVGSSGKAIGMFNQDRSAGIGGVMDKFPGILPIRVNVRDADSGIISHYAAQMVIDEEATPILATAAVISFIDKTVNRVGRGTVKLGFAIDARNLPGETFIRENMFYAPEGLAETSAMELMEYLTVLMNNPYKKIGVFDLVVNAEVTSDCKAALILSAKAEKETAAPGEKVAIDVKLKPYRGDTITQKAYFTVPKNQPVGELSLFVRGGSVMPYLKAMEIIQIEEENAIKKKQKIEPSFELLVHNLNERDHNNDIVVEMLPADMVAIGNSVKDEIENVKKANKKDSNKGAGEMVTNSRKGKPWLNLAWQSDNFATMAEAAPPEKGSDKDKTKESAIDILRAIEKIENNKPYHRTSTDYIIDGDTEINVEIVPAAKSMAKDSESKKTAAESAVLEQSKQKAEGGSTMAKEEPKNTAPANSPAADGHEKQQ